LTGRDGDGSLGPAGAPSEIDPSWRRPPGSKDFDGGIDSYVSSPGGDGGGDGSDALPAFDARRLNRRFAASTSAEVTPGLTGRTGEGWASDEAEACNGHESDMGIGGSIDELATGTGGTTSASGGRIVGRRPGDVIEPSAVLIETVRSGEMSETPRSSAVMSSLLPDVMPGMYGTSAGAAAPTGAMKGSSDAGGAADASAAATSLPEFEQPGLVGRFSDSGFCSGVGSST